MCTREGLSGGQPRVASPPRLYPCKPLIRQSLPLKAASKTWYTLVITAANTSPSPIMSPWPKRESMSPQAAWETPKINALAETVNGLYKAELVYAQTGEGLAEVEWATLCCVHCWNTSCLHSELRYRTPQEIDNHYWHIHSDNTQLTSHRLGTKPRTVPCGSVWLYLTE